MQGRCELVKWGSCFLESRKAGSRTVMCNAQVEYFSNNTEQLTHMLKNHLSFYSSEAYGWQLLTLTQQLRHLGEVCAQSSRLIDQFGEYPYLWLFL